MEVKKLQENNELEKRAKQHGKKSKGLSSHCKLNPDAGNVEHNVAMFNHMSSPSGGPSTNPCGPMAEGLNESAELIDLHYDKLKVTIVTRQARPASYYFEYDRDEAQTVEEYIEYDYTVKKSEVVDFICENMTENDFANIEDASDAELVAFVNEHFDDLYSKYEKMILEYFEDSAREHAEMQMSDDYLSEDTIQVNEKFIRSLGEDLNSLFATKNVDKNTAKEISKLEALYEKYNKIDDKRHVKAITEKVRYALHSCSDNKSGCLNESVDAEYVIMAVHNDGKKQYYNVSSVPHWVDKGQDATIFNDMDEARTIWFKLDKKPFKRVFIPNYDPEKMNEAVDADKLYAQDMMTDRIDDLFDFAMRGYFSRFIQPYVYRVYNRNKQASVVVKFDIDNPKDKFSFSVDGKHHTANTESDAAKIIQNAVDSKYSSSFDLALEDLSDRIRKDDLEYDDSIDAWTASEGDTQIQFQDREQHTHEFKTKTNQWGRNFVDGQYNKQPKVASHTWGRVWKDGQLVKQAEGPKYQVRAEIAKYLDAEGNIDEDWTPPENWMSYKGAWIYPVEGGYEANFTGEHFEAATLDELKAKLRAARVHRQKFSGYSERDAELANKIKSFGKEITEDTEDVTRYQMEFYLDGDDTRRTEYVYAESEDEAISKLNARVGECSVTAAIAERVPARYKDWDMTERWNPNLVDCPACGGVSFDSKRGSCTQCSYRESLDEASYGGAFDIADDQYFTRDDLVECAEKVIEHLNETFDDVFELYNVEMNGVTLQIEVEGKELGWYMEKCRIDMRKIRVPSDLTNKYALEFASKFIATIKDYNNI